MKIMKISKSKTTLFILCAMLMCNLAFAQKKKIEEVNGNVMVDGNPYAKLVKTNAELFSNNFSFQNLSGVELIYLQYHTRERQTRNEKTGKWETHSYPYYVVNFIKSGASVMLSEGTLGEKGAMKIVVENNLIKDEAIDPVAEERYVRVNNGKGAAPKNEVAINGEQISLDGKVIGKILPKSGQSESEGTMSFSIYNNSGEKVAEAEAPVVNPSEWNVKTMSDGKTTSILYESTGAYEKLCKWCVDKQYLK